MNKNLEVACNDLRPYVSRVASLVQRHDAALMGAALRNFLQNLTHAILAEHNRAGTLLPAAAMLAAVYRDAETKVQAKIEMRWDQDGVISK